MPLCQMHKIYPGAGSHGMMLITISRLPRISVKAMVVRSIALARFDLILPLRILLLVMSGLSVTTGILLYRLIGKIFVPALGAVAALFWVFNHHIFATLYQNGLESGIAAFFVVLLVYKLYEF